ncbi:P-selectin glycoprotein ligand 1 [Dendropsophus ebraccatus]|uniref:P-selectin glycoprotein ligand 1 n=1 Tax=Dendropsophus ebraccatus TaxID=150705 RepID=UPI003831F911
MSFLATALLLCLWLSSAIAYKLPLLNGAILTDEDGTMDKPNNSPFGKNYKWEWQSQDRVDKGTLLSRLRRDTDNTNKGDGKLDGKIIPKSKPTDLPLDKFSNVTPYILKASSAAFIKAKTMALLDEDETTPLTVLKQTTKRAGQELDEDETTPLTDREQTTKRAGQELVDDETTPLTKPEQTAKKAGQELEEETTHVDKSVTQLKTMATELNPTTSEKLSVLTVDKYKKATTVHSTDSQDTSTQQITTNGKLLEDNTPSLPKKTPETSATSTTAILHGLTTGHEVSSTGSSVKPAAVTHTPSPSEDQVNTQSLMRQCMLTILILAVVCTIFIISTIALAAKLSSMKQKSKLRHPATYTEMRCISSLLPDSDQHNKPQPKRLKTFASSMEESDGDNTTLNSFLPDH